MSTFNLAASKKYAYATAGAIILIILVLFGAILFGGKNQKENTGQNTQIQTLLPYYTRDFTIVYAPDKNQLHVNVINPPYETNRQKAIEWLKNQGVDIDSQNIIYSPKNKFPDQK